MGLNCPEPVIRRSAIIEQAAVVTRGYLAYTTCTFHPKRMKVSFSFLEAATEFDTVPIAP
jgi:hypothetical protein